MSRTATIRLIGLQHGLVHARRRWLDHGQHLFSLKTLFRLERQCWIDYDFYINTSDVQCSFRMFRVDFLFNKEFSMSQTYHNHIRVTGPAADRLQATIEALKLNMPTCNWDWIEAQIEVKDKKNPKGRDADIAKWDFYSRNYPDRLDELSTKFPSLILDCNLMDITGDRAYLFKLQDGRVWEEKTEDIFWGCTFENKMTLENANRNSWTASE